MNITGFGVVTAVVRVHRCPGFLKRTFGSTLWGETLLMRGINMEVHDTFQLLDDLNHESSLASRN